MKEQDIENMKKVYYDISEEAACIGIIAGDPDTEVIFAGTAVHSMPVGYKNTEYQRYADEYDIHFIFDDFVPYIDFYTVPYVRILAVDSCGGYLGELCCGKGEGPACYISREKKVFLAAQSLQELWNNPVQWQERLVPCNRIALYPSKAAAEKELNFIKFPESPDDFRQFLCKK